MSNLTKSFIFIGSCAVVFYTITFFFGVKEKGVEKAESFDWVKSVRVYFVDINQVRETSCEANSYVERVVMNGETLGPGAIEALIKGLTEEESNYLSTAINPNTNILKFNVSNGVAHVDFDENLNKNVGGSCYVTSIRTQIENTLLDLPDIDEVIISVRGETEGILEP